MICTKFSINTAKSHFLCFCVKAKSQIATATVFRLNDNLDLREIQFVCECVVLLAAL